ncbi:MAG: hypothetical protein AAB263_03825 [Planctomycetota bacterium]
MPHAHQLDPALTPEAVLADLAPEVRRLTQIVITLYGSSWDACAEDVRRRRSGQPYLYRIDLPGVDELEWIACIKTYEAARGESLAATITSAEKRL